LTGLSFTVMDARVEPLAAAPTIAFRVRIQAAAGQAIHAVLLRSVIQIDARRRQYVPHEQERMADLFGEAPRWRETLRPLVWARASVTVPAFEGSTEIEIPAACTYDFEVAAAKYLAALEGGQAPLLFLFSGTVFAKTDSGFGVQQIGWDQEAAWRMPVKLWREAMDTCFPGCAWIRIGRESLEALQRFRARNGFLSWDDTLAALMHEIKVVGKEA
jgi:Family of unknown function (DUF6084)